MNLFKRFEYFFFAVIVAVLYYLPFPVLEWMARRVGDAAYFLLPKRRKIGLENLDIVYKDKLSLKEKKHILRKSLQNSIISVMELITVKRMLPVVKDHFSFEGREYLDAAFSYKKGVVFVISHLGSWEYLSFLPLLTGMPSSVIVKNVKNPYLSKKMNDLRKVTTVTPIPKDEASLKKIFQELHKEHLVGILIDQWSGGEGIWTNFFGKPTSTTSIPARLGKKTSTFILPAFCIRTDRRQYKIVIKPPLNPNFASGYWERSITEHLNHILETEILKYPEQWNWVHRRWKDKPSNLREPSSISQ